MRGRKRERGTEIEGLRGNKRERERKGEKERERERERRVEWRMRRKEN